jgi:hypothetical protein
MYRMDYPYDPDGDTYNGLNDDGQAIEFRLKGKFFDLGKPANDKNFKKWFFTLYSELVSYDIDLATSMDRKYFTDEKTIINAVSRCGELRFGDRLNNRETNLNYPVLIKYGEYKHNIQYELVCTGLNMAWHLLSIVLKVDIKELK